MSVIVSLVSSKGAIVASDGRMYGPAVFREWGLVEIPSKILSDEHDKTFKLERLGLCSTFCGLMSFSGRSIPEHVNELASSICLEVIDTWDIAETIGNGMKGRLENVDANEVGVAFRTIDLLFSGRQVKGGGPGTVAIRLASEGKSIGIESKTFHANGGWAYCSAGDDLAKAECLQFLDRTKQAGTQGLGTSTLGTLARKTIRRGIKKSGLYKGNGCPSCGGKTFVKQIRW